MTPCEYLGSVPITHATVAVLLMGIIGYLIGRASKFYNGPNK